MDRRGVTLIELMVVVIIIGVLASIATVSYRKTRASVHTVEAIEMVNSIRSAETRAFRERNEYLDTSGASATSGWCPGDNVLPNAQKRGWDPECGGPRAKWKELSVKVQGPVIFQYTVVAGSRVGIATINDAAAGGVLNVQTFAGKAQNFAAVPAGEPFYIVVARADPLDQGSVKARVMTHSHTANVSVEENF